MISGPTLLRPYRIWHSERRSTGHYRSPAVDAALDRVRYATSDDDYVAPASPRSSRRSIDDPPAIFLAWTERARAVSKRFVRPASNTAATS